jgi:hypothetical protein
MVTTLVDGFRTLSHEDENETGTGKERKGVEQFVDLNKIPLRDPKENTVAGTTHHGERDVRVRGPNVSLHK